MISMFDCVPAVDRCRFLGNTASGDGGGLYNYSNCSLTLTSCEFSGNSAANGGAINSLFSSNVQIINCSISGNTATSAGGGVNNYQCSPVLSNSLLWGNSVGGTFNQAAQLVNFSSTPSVNYCSIQGGAAGLGGSGNNGTDPQFVSAKGPDNSAGTLDDNLRLIGGSPAIDTGSNALVPGGSTLHLGGGPRVISGTVDRGAYEYTPSIPGDLTVDGDVDDDDVALLGDCFTGPAIPYDPQNLPAGCTLTPNGNGKIAADFNLDGDVDQEDFGIVQRCYSGEGNPANPGCAN
jgi:predicted outer membrane repeat protein